MKTFIPTKSTTEEQRPTPDAYKAALALKNALALSISPKQDDLAGSRLDLVKFGKFTEVLIDLGNKPTTTNKVVSH
jgi:hypothetical protein